MEKSKGAVRFVLIFACSAIVYFLVKQTFFLLFPIFLAFLFSEGIRNSLARLHPLAASVKRILTVLLLLIFFALMSLVAVLLAERFLHYSARLTKFLSENSESIVSYCKDQIHRMEEKVAPILGNDPKSRITLYLPTLFQDFLKKALELVTTWIGTVATTLPRFFISLVIFIISCYYFSCDWDCIRVFWKEKMPAGLQTKLSVVKKHFFRSLRQYGKAYLLLFLLNFAILYLGLVLLKSKNAFGLSLLIALIDLLPVLGCGAVLVPWAIVSFFAGNAGTGIGLTALFVITLFAHQCAEPKIVGSSIGLHPVLSLILVLLGLKLFGIWGMILLPLLVTSYLAAEKENEA